MQKKINPQDSWEILKEKKKSYIVDLRSEPETMFGGKPDLSEFGKDTIEIPYLDYPSMQENKNFTKLYNKYIFNKDSITFLLCKDGSISERAIEKIKGIHDNCYLIEKGFDGDLDLEEKKRSRINGWKASGLPWGEY